MPLSGLLIAAPLMLQPSSRKRANWASELLVDPVFGACILTAGGYILFMTYQNHPQPRYFALVAVFCFLISPWQRQALRAARFVSHLRLGCGGLAAIASLVNGVWTVNLRLAP